MYRFFQLIGTKCSNHFTLYLLYQTTERMLLKLLTCNYWRNLVLLQLLIVFPVPFLQSLLFTVLLSWLRLSTNCLVYTKPPTCLKECLKESSQRLHGNSVTYLWVQEWLSLLSFKISSEYLSLYPLGTTLLSRTLYRRYGQPSTLDGTVRSLRVKLMLAKRLFCAALLCLSRRLFPPEF